MANVVSMLVPTSAIARGRKLRIDNYDLDIAVINHDSSTTATIISTLLKRIISAQFFNWSGTVLTPTVTGYGTNTLTVSVLPADNKGITVLLKGSKL
jgi:hypothetical protein